MTVKERLIKFIKYKKISTREFCREIGVSETYVSSMRMSIQPDKTKIISEKFPELSMTWLFTGDGQMINPLHLPAIDKEKFTHISSEVFKDKIIEMFKNGEIYSAHVVTEQNKLISSLFQKIGELQSEVETLKNKLAQHGITNAILFCAMISVLV
jgi:hypothetical protein